MAAKDIYHQTVIDAPEKDGWAITHDPLELRYGNRRLKIDLGAERLIGAERNSQKIAVEIKSFLSDSAIYDLENAVGQYNVYREVLALQEPERMLYLAVPQYIYKYLSKSKLVLSTVVTRPKIPKNICSGTYKWNF